MVVVAAALQEVAMVEAALVQAVAMAVAIAAALVQALVADPAVADPVVAFPSALLQVLEEQDPAAWAWVEARSRQCRTSMTAWPPT